MTNKEWQLERLHQLKEFGERVSRYDGNELLLVSVDDNFCSMLGYSRAELMICSHGKVSEMIYTPDLLKVYPEMLKKIQEEGHYTCSYRMKKSDGFLLWVWESGICETDDRGNEVIRSLVVNITKEEQIRRERDTTYDNIPGGVMTILVTDDNFYITEANHQYFSMMGTTREEYLGSSGVYTFTQDLPGLRNHIVDQAKEGNPVDYEFRTRHAARQDTRWYRILGQYYQESSEGKEYLCTLLDITEDKKNVFQLEREKERYRIAMGIMADILFEYDMERKQLRLYEDSRNMGFRPCINEQMRGSWPKVMKSGSLIYSEDKGKLDLFNAGELSTSAQIRVLTEEKKTGDKTYQWYQYVATKVMDQGRVTRIVGSLKNIEKQKRQEESHKEISNIFEVLSNRIYEMILRVEIRNREVKGYFMDGTDFHDVYPSSSYDEFLEKTAKQYVHPDEADQFRSVFCLENMLEILNCSSMEEVLFFRVRQLDTEYRYKCFRFSYLGNDSEVIIISAQDMHEFRTRQLQLEDADRKIMEAALNEVKGTVEVRRNFLAILAREVQGPMQFLYTSLRKSEITKDMLEEMQYASHYVLQIIQNMSEYEKIEQGKIRVENRSFSLGDTMDSILDVWVPRARHVGMELECNLNFRWDAYFGDEVHFRQVLNNIIGNCVKIAEPNSKLRIWGNVEDQGGGTSCISLMFEDRGFPIEESYFGRAYPMDVINDKTDWKIPEGASFTTFSLVLARRITELLGGHLHLSRRGDDINIISLELPFQRAGEPCTKKGVELLEEDMPREAVLDSYNILVVEREDADSNLVGARLKINGAQVDVAYTGKEGLELWKSYAADVFDVVLVEGYLPDMDYVTFARTFRHQKGAADIPVFVMVEDIRQESIHTSVESGINAFLKKPLELKRLQQMLDAYYGKDKIMSVG